MFLDYRNPPSSDKFCWYTYDGDWIIFNNSKEENDCYDLVWMWNASSLFKSTVFIIHPTNLTNASLHLADETPVACNHPRKRCLNLQMLSYQCRVCLIMDILILVRQHLYTESAHYPRHIVAMPLGGVLCCACPSHQTHRSTRFSNEKSLSWPFFIHIIHSH